MPFDVRYLHQEKNIWQASPGVSGRWVCMARSCHHCHPTCKLVRANVQCVDACPLWFTEETNVSERAVGTSGPLPEHDKINSKNLRASLRWNSTRQHILTVAVRSTQTFMVYFSELLQTIPFWTNTSWFLLTVPSDLGLVKPKRPNRRSPLNMILLVICAQETRGLEAKGILSILTPTHLSMTLLRCCLDLLLMLLLPPTPCLRVSPSMEAVMLLSSTRDMT